MHRQVMENRRRQTNAERYLPLPDTTRLIEVGDTLTRLSEMFTDLAGARLVSLEGIGGIGKTALARAFVALPEVIVNWPVILWVSARQASLAEDGSLLTVVDPATTLEDISIRMAEQLGLTSLSGKPLVERLEGLHSSLANKKTLVVVDNLETIEEHQVLVPALAKLAGLSRFLITTHQRLRGFPFVHTIPLNELSSDEAYNLMSAE